MPTEARKQPCVTWGKHEGSLAEESLADQDWAKFIEDREGIPPTPLVPKPRAPTQAPAGLGQALLKMLLLEPADTEPLPAPSWVASPSHWNKAWVCCHSRWHQPCASMSCTWRRMGEATEMLVTKQVWCPLPLHFHVECLTAGDRRFGIAQGDSQLSALVDSTAINDLTIVHKTKIQMHEQVYLLEKFFTSRAFKLWIYSGMDCIQFKANFISEDHCCYNTYYQCRWMLL